MTYRQALKLGGHVRKGETSTLVAYADRFRWTKTDEEGDEQTLERWFWKGYLVFNIEQIDGLPEHYHAPANTEALAESERVARVESFVEQTGAVVETSGSLAAYRLDKDAVLMPPFPSFADAESYYATLLLELTLWTRHPSRLDRAVSSAHSCGHSSGASSAGGRLAPTTSTGATRVSNPLGNRTWTALETTSARISVWFPLLAQRQHPASRP